MVKASDNLFPKVILEEVATDGSATVTPAADYRAMFLGEDGGLHLKDSAGAVTDVGGSGAVLTTDDLAVTYLIDGGGSAITTGIKGPGIYLPFTGHIRGVVLLADQAGDIVIDLWKDTYTNYPPTVLDTITASAKPTLSGVAKSKDTTLTGWTTAFSADDIIRVNVDSASTVTSVALVLIVDRS